MINNNKKDRRIEKTEYVLVNSLAALMHSKNIKDISVKELCEYANVNRGTFYLHYNDIYDMRELFHHKCIENWLSSHTPKLIANYDYFSNFLVYGCVGLIENWIVTGKKETPEEISALVTKLVSTGVTSLL